MKIYDMVVKIHNKTMEHIEELDEMLNQYGVDHVFVYPADEEIDEDEGLKCKCLYMYEDDMTFNLVTLLFCKTVLNISDANIKETMKKVAA